MTCRSSPVIVRDYRAQDLTALVELFHNSVWQVASRDYTQEQLSAWAPRHPDMKVWAERLGGRPTLVATVDAHIRGFSDIEPDGHIDMMFVDAGFQRRGVATALLHEIERRAERSTQRRLFTEASLTARPFFERHGFAVLSAQEVEVRGRRLLNYRMEKLLLPSHWPD